jgi:hypothetical protein
MAENSQSQGGFLETTPAGNPQNYFPALLATGTLTRCWESGGRSWEGNHIQFFTGQALLSEGRLPSPLLHVMLSFISLSQPLPTVQHFQSQNHSSKPCLLPEAASNWASAVEYLWGPEMGIHSGFWLLK